MASDEIHIGDIGTVITTIIQDGTTVVDISGSTSTTRHIVFGKPDGTFSTQTASLTGTGSDGSMYFTVNTSTFWDIEGYWKIQSIVTLGTSKFHSDVYPFRVHSNLV